MATSPDTIISAFQESGIIPVFYHDDADVCLAVMQACYDGGLRVFEFTSRGANAKKNFEILRKQQLATMPDLHLGIGTIKKAEDAAIYSALGAEFIVSPIIDIETAEYCRSAKLLWVPGCMTPTEISVAEKQGARLIKLFPGNVLGPGYVKAIKPLFPGIKFMPTGGVEPTKESIASWMDAGVVCVGMGSNLISKALVESKDWATLKEKVLQSFAIIKGMK